MHQVIDTYPELFVFAKENCFNGVSIPKELIPLLEFGKVFPVDRKSSGGSMTAIKLYYENKKSERKQLSKEKREIQEELKYQKRQEKKKQKKRGH